MGGSSSTNTGSNGATSGNGLASFQGGSSTPSYNKESFNNLLGADAASVYSQGPKVNQELQYGGLSAQTQAGLNGLYGASQQPNSFGAATQFSNGLLANANNPSLTEQQLGGVARGEYLNGANPYFEQNLQNSLQDAGTGVNAALGANGRYGSSVHVNQLGTTLGQLSTSARSSQYENERNRQAQALAAIEGQRQQGINNGQWAASNAGSLYQNSLLPYQTQLGVGQAFDADRQAAITARDQLFQNNANAPYDQLVKYQQLQNGTAQQTVTRQPGLLDYLGAGAGLASAFL